MPQFDSIDVVFLPGTGIAEGSWTPVLEAIAECTGGEPVGSDVDAANLFFARHVHRRRFVESVARFSDERIRTLGDHTRSDREIAEFRYEIELDLANIRAKDYQIKNAIYRHLTKKQAEIKVRPRFSEVLERFPKETTYAMITTNWDLSLQQAFQNLLIWYLHGSIEDPRTLYLPSEAIHEPYRTASELALFEYGGKGWQVFHRAKTLVIYGLSLSPLDPGLSRFLETGLSERQSNPPDILIFDCAQRLPGLERRVRMLLPPSSKPKTVTEDVGDPNPCPCPNHHGGSCCG